MLTYKGYHAVAEYRPDDRLIFGEVIGLDDAVIFEVKSADEVEAAFHAAVDDYLAFCKKIGKEPEKAYSGKFNVRVEPGVHREAAVLSRSTGVSLNDFVMEAMKREARRRKRQRA